MRQLKTPAEVTPPAEEASRDRAYKYMIFMKPDRQNTVTLVPTESLQVYLKDLYAFTSSPLDVWGAIWELSEPDNISSQDLLHRLLFRVRQEDARSIHQYFGAALRGLMPERSKDDRFQFEKR
jgi:hypothetical protein